jgi:hypothetical protein
MCHHRINTKEGQMIEIRLEATTVGEMHDQMRQLLRGSLPSEAANDTAPKSQPLGEPKMALSETTDLRAVVREHFNVEERQPAPARGRGRPRKNAVPEPQSVSIVADTSGDQPAVSDNTGSAPTASTPAVEGVQEGAVVAEPTAAAASPVSLTMDEVRGKLAELASAAGGIEKATKIINGFGYAKVKEIKEEHFSAIYKATVEALG